MFPRRGVVAMASLLGVVAGSRVVDSATDSAMKDWRQALALYKQKKFDLACPLFESAATSKGKNGAIWGDLGLCELKRGRVAESVHASLLAVRFGQAEVRKAAYFNLNLARSFVAITSGECTELAAPPELECSKPAFVCGRRWEMYGTGMGTDGTVAFFGEKRKSVEERANAYDQSFMMDPTPAGALPLSKDQRCFAWCSAHPEVNCRDGDYCKEGPLLDCSVVAVDACQKRIGYVCLEWDDVGGPKRTFVYETEFPEEEASQ